MLWLLTALIAPAAAMTLHFLPSDAYFSAQADQIAWGPPTVKLSYDRIETWTMLCGTAGFQTLTVTDVRARDVKAILQAVDHARGWWVPTADQPERPRFGVRDPVFVLVMDRRAPLDRHRPGLRYNEHIQSDVAATADHPVDHVFDIDPGATDVPSLVWTAPPTMHVEARDDGRTIHRQGGTVRADAIQWVVARRTSLDGTAEPRDRVFWTVRRGRLRMHRW